ncbi:MAG: AAA family ATPase [Actinobacteria bacterium]|nr:AAA family ATPase [Actinomycetota bacterium]
MRRLRTLPSLPPIDTTALPSADAGDPSRYIAPPLRGRLRCGDLEHEHRRASVGFAHFGGIDELLDEEGAGETFARVQHLTTTAMTALAEYRVLLTATDVACGGGTLMLTAGAPDATGDDAARMLRVARRIIDADCGLPVRIGVNAGNVFVGSVGAPLRRTYSTMGAATNLAARVMGKAPWDGVLATTAVLDDVGERFVVTPVEPFTVRGRDQPVSAGLVEATVRAATAAADRSVPFTGREDELAVLEAAVADVRAGHGRVVEIIGEPGVGKSRLVAEVRAQAEDLPWIGSSCDPYEATSPYHTSSALLRRILRIPIGAAPADAGAVLADIVAADAAELTPWVPLLAVAARADVASTPESADVAPRYRRGRIHQAVGDLLSTLATEPAVVVLEDAQHMDDASAELIAALLARLLPGHPWLVVITRTADDTGLHAGRGYDATRLPLAPLDTTTAADLAGRLAEHTPVPVHRLAELVERAAGNLLFLAALVTAQADGRDELPRSIEAIIAARIDELDPDDRRTLRYLSVLGERFDAALLDATLRDRGITSDQLDRWWRLSEFITVDDGGFVFRNALVREVAYEGLAFRRRRDLHALVADAIASSTELPASQLPVHLLRAERWNQAWTATRGAAIRARDSGANAVAGELYEMALRAARRLALTGGEIAATAIDAGEVWERAGLWARALDAYSVAAAATDQPQQRLDILLRRARVHEGAGRYPQALRLYRRVLTCAEAFGDATAHARCLARARAGYASARLGQGRAADTVVHARDAVDDAERAGDDHTLAQAYHLLDRAHSALGDHDTAARYRDLALPVFAALGDLAAQGTVLHDLGDDALRAGRLDEALWLYERSHEVRSRAGDVVRTAASDNAIGAVLLRLGEVDAAHARFTAALRAWRGARSPRGIAEATRNLGIVELRRGRDAHAVELLEEADAVAVQVGAEALHDEILVPLAESLARSGRYVEAWEVATRALAVADPRTVGAARRLRGTALLRTGGVTRARDELTMATAAAAAAGDDDGEAAARRLLDELV